MRLLSLVSVVLIIAAVSAKNVPSAVSVKKINDVTIIDDIRNYARSHPGTKIIQMNKEQSKGRSQSVRYTLGSRLSGDRLVAQGTDTYSYPSPNDISLQLSYPEQGSTGAILTFVELISIQNNFNGNAYVISGGIGLRSISLVIEAQETDYFSYKAQYFGV